jgi:hypothetical protein
MTMKPPSMRRRSPYSFGILAVVFSAAAFYVSTGLGQLWPLTWIAPVPVLIVAFRRPWQRAALIAFGAFFLGCGTLVSAYGPGAWLIFGFPRRLVLRQPRWPPVLQPTVWRAGWRSSRFRPC